MKNLLSLPGAAAVVLAGISVYLGHQLGEVRARAHAAETRVAELEMRLKFSDRMRPAASEPSAPSPAPAASAPPDSVAPSVEALPDAGGDQPVARMRRGDNWQVRMARVPSSRALLRAERVVRLKEQNPRLARALGISETEANELLEFIADQDIRTQLDLAKRSGDDRFAQFRELQAQQERELTAKVGEERMRKYQAYQKGAPDRAQVSTFRSRLSESMMLSDEQTYSLAAALQEAREQTQQEIRDQIGENPTFTTISASGRYVGTNIDRSDEDGQERQIVEQIELYARRANERAATVLTPQQMKVFEEFQAGQVVTGKMRIRTMRETDPKK